MFPIADQQEGRQRCQFPEHQQQQDVVGQNDAHHRALEQQKIGEELTHIVIPRQVIAPVNDDQRSDPEDQRRKERTKRIQHQGHVQPQGRKPFETLGDHLSGHQIGDVGYQPDQGSQRDRKRSASTGLTSGRVQNTWKKRSQKWKGNN